MRTDDRGPRRLSRAAFLGRRFHSGPSTPPMAEEGWGSEYENRAERVWFGHGWFWRFLLRPGPLPDADQHSLEADPRSRGQSVLQSVIKSLFVPQKVLSGAASCPLPRSPGEKRA